MLAGRTCGSWRRRCVRIASAWTITRPVAAIGVRIGEENAAEIDRHRAAYDASKG